ncbi:hypothetical protein C8C76_12613 [Halanaerobium saccharolyticum]|jgi:hypothetical protein|uniref:Phosphate-selective porin O/P n=1 Tax=Halanaerobium saccharolyticum TaxID=43595 RepID=A0A2T5RHK1_9FIRM|nr:hypothetical protein [Halanaerobium saccharolyticum]PTV96176.1 hypothetical protein C8C76_12613 [Halanaerobium saccharolyticum]TDP98235.1 hypothetical protein C7957_10534 [Halanaerobium saccharolyticum]
MKFLKSERSFSLTLIICLAAAALLFSSSLAGAAYISHKVTGYTTYDLENSSELYSYLEYDLKLEQRLEKGQFVLNPKLQINTLEEELELELYEGYLDYYFSNADLRIGRQIISWGKADGLTVTNLINDQSRVQRPFVNPDDRFLGSDAFKLDYYTDSGTLEAVISLPPRDSDLDADQSGFGLRYSVLGMGSDYEISAGSFPQYNPMLEVYNRVTGSSEALYRDQNFIGGSFSNDLGKFVLKGEGAYFFNRDYLQQTEKGPQIVENNELELLVGIDYYLGDYLIALQAKEGILIDEPNNLVRDKTKGEYSLLVQRSFMRDNLNLENWLIYREMPELPNMEDTLLWRPRLSYDYSDQLTLSTGLDHVIDGPEKSEIFAQIEYTF